MARRPVALGALIIPSSVAVALNWVLYKSTLVRWLEDDTLGRAPWHYSLGVPLLAILVGLLGWWLQWTATAFVVAQDAYGQRRTAPQALRFALRRLPRVAVAETIYWVIAAAVLAAPVWWLAGILLNNEQFEGFLWMWFAANLVAYSLPWGNLFLSAARLDDTWPRFRRVRELVRGNGFTTLWRILLVHVISVAVYVFYNFVETEPWSLAALGLGVTVVPLTNVVIVVAYTLMYVDLAAVGADPSEVGADPPAPNDRWTRWQQWQSGQTAPP
ncbi:hypothetical protein [Candidatus Poriferisodalis sp.]|uniref:hypothetical protein n=1 Tax=Candidatus Poriferisodalis sp. TaxID=3101277 RepID=UPI003B019B49